MLSDQMAIPIMFPLYPQIYPQIYPQYIPTNSVLANPPFLWLITLNQSPVQWGPLIFHAITWRWVYIPIYIYILSWSGRPHKLPTTDGKLVNKPMPFHGWANHQRFLLFLLKIRIRLSVCGSTSDLVKWHPGHTQGKRGCSRFTIFGSPAALCRASPRLTAVAEQPLSHRGNELQSLLFEPGQLRCRLTNQAMVHAVLALPSLHHSTSRGLKIDMARLLRPSKTPLINAVSYVSQNKARPFTARGPFVRLHWSWSDRNCFLHTWHSGIWRGRARRDAFDLPQKIEARTFSDDKEQMQTRMQHALHCLIICEQRI